MFDKQIKDVLERIEAQANKKEFKINTAEECGLCIWLMADGTQALSQGLVPEF